MQVIGLEFRRRKKRVAKIELTGRGLLFLFDPPFHRCYSFDSNQKEKIDVKTMARDYGGEK